MVNVISKAYVDVTDLATREAQSKVQLTVSEITEKQFLSPLVKENLRSHMPSASYLKNVEMHIAEMLPKILEIGRGDLLVRGNRQNLQCDTCEERGRAL